MEKIKISKLAKQVRGVSYAPENLHDNLNDNSVILLRANNIDDGKINFDGVVYVDKSKVSKDQYLKKGDILICASSGSKQLVGKAASVDFDSECTFGAFCKVVRPVPEMADYLGAFFQSDTYRNKISEVAIGANINNIRNEHIDSLDIPVRTPSEIVDVVKKVRIIQHIIDRRKMELQKLDDLVKARFVELFGDPISNSFDLNTKPMTDICEIIDGDRGKNYPTADDFYDEGYCLFLNAKNVTSDGFSFENCMFITKEKDETLRKGRLSRGDVVLTTRGTIGNLAFYTDKIPYEHIRINSGMVILRMKQELIDEVYFIEHFKMQLADIKSKIASGSAQPQLPISTMNKIQILVPEIEQQRDFANFVEQSEKSKAAVQKSLDKLQILFDSLMQEYFD